MPSSLRLNPEDFPDSRYAAELRRNTPGLRFAAPIEEEYRQAHLRRMRLRVRGWMLVGTGVTCMYGTLDLIHLGLRSFETALNGILLLALLSAMWFVYSEHFERRYLSVATFAVPLMCCGVAVLAVREFARGHIEQLILIPSLLLSTFFMAGVLFRGAIASGVAMVLSFVITALLSGIPEHSVFACTGLLIVSLVIATAVAWDTEQSYRESFLEARLVSELAALDGLTGVKNRRAFDEHLMRVWQQGQRDRRALAVMLIDCDHFKRYNDGRGHQAGDEALRRIARIIDRFARHPLDIAARYGGEEFALVLYDISPIAARRLAEELRLAVEDAAIEHDRSSPIAVMTVSIGVALVRPTPGHSPPEAIQIADEALYTAKRSGRNHVSILKRSSLRESHSAADEEDGAAGYPKAS